MGNLKLFLAAFSGAVVFTILLVSANTVAMSVRERIRETAILRTLGFTPGEIRGLILGESGLLSLVGGIIGGGLAWALCDLSFHSNADFRLPMLKSWMAGAVIAFAVVMGVCSAAMPAFFASRRKIVDSMRYAG
jgi:putative ABC transport system permease protein